MDPSGGCRTWTKSGAALESSAVLTPASELVTPEAKAECGSATVHGPHGMETQQQPRSLHEVGFVTLPEIQWRFIAESRLLSESLQNRTLCGFFQDAHWPWLLARRDSEPRPREPAPTL